MRKSFILLSVMLLLSSFCFSQELIRQQPCYIDYISKQADSLRNLYAKQGFVLVRETSMTMKSEYEMPVIIPLTKGTWYQFIFIGEYSSRLYEVRMYDWQEKMVIFRQNKWGDVDGNIISYTYIPKFSEFHMIKPLQVNKKKKNNLCGYIMMFKKINDKEAHFQPSVKGKNP